ncbi:hypothetical protein [Aquipseudomonas ullengensis]|uniref:Uncharacterized protein n=1 Tax=Aquipseudomonas ullengensis TaxID=2759166 RepID=A0A7W4LKL3_9GAMM|nr:hypothetical protein [Pseudomonas ullengensis]MBB2494861.1 hypothetical protein [Pseudomonas ullengensis]
MQNVTESIILGIVAGLLTSAVLLITKSIIINILLPLYRQFMYRGIHINGTWHHINSSQKLLLELKQNCEKLSGKATLQWISSNNHFHIESIRTFDVSGCLETRFITLTFRHTDRSRLGIITCLLQVDGDGTILSGQRCWYAPLATKINSGGIRLYRDERRALDAAPRPAEQYQTDETNESYESYDANELNDIYTEIEDAELYEEADATETGKQINPKKQENNVFEDR